MADGLIHIFGGSVLFLLAITNVIIVYGQVGIAGIFSIPYFAMTIASLLMIGVPMLISGFIGYYKKQPT